jgi:hypothetical protein
MKRSTKLRQATRVLRSMEQGDLFLFRSSAERKEVLNAVHYLELNSKAGAYGVPEELLTLLGAKYGWEE